MTALEWLVGGTTTPFMYHDHYSFLPADLFNILLPTTTYPTVIWLMTVGWSNETCDTYLTMISSDVGAIAEVRQGAAT